jgi:nicotinamidase-related amidase
VAPQPGEPNVTSGPDKFVNTDLDKILKDKSIKTVIAVGTASNGAVLFTASAAVFRGMDVIVPVDGMSSNDRYIDLTTAYTFATAPRLSQKVTLTTLDKVSF